jgi:hypothetical protein
MAARAVLLIEALFLMRSYEEDEIDREPGIVFDLIVPIWRVGEALL